MHLLLWEGLKGLGLQPFVTKDEFRLATVNTIKCVPHLPEVELEVCQAAGHVPFAVVVSIRMLIWSVVSRFTYAVFLAGRIENGVGLCSGWTGPLGVSPLGCDVRCGGCCGFGK